jgi:hypothetical protein
VGAGDVTLVTATIAIATFADPEGNEFDLIAA